MEANGAALALASVAGRIRALLEETVARGAHRMLWVPPSLPYYQQPAVDKSLELTRRSAPRQEDSLDGYDQQRGVHFDDVLTFKCLNEHVVGDSTMLGTEPA